MRKTLFSLAPIALLALAGCNNDTAETTDDAATQAAADAEPITLPPAIVDSGVYRCADSSVIYVDFYEGGRRAGLRTEQNGTSTILNAPQADAMATPEAGMTPQTAEAETETPTLTGGDGYALMGTGQNIQVTLPGKDMQTCKSS
jgi:hypothetical protein